MLNLLLLLHFWHQVSSYDVSTYPWLKFGGELGLELADCSWAVVSLNEHLWGDDRMLEILQAVGLETKVPQLGSHLRVLNCVPCFHFRMEHVFKCLTFTRKQNTYNKPYKLERGGDYLIRKQYFYVCHCVVTFSQVTHCFRCILILAFTLPGGNNLIGKWRIKCIIIIIII